MKFFASVYVGSEVAMRCLSHGKTSWYYKNMTSLPFSIHQSIRWKVLGLSSSGDYYCYGSYKTGNNFIAKKTLKVYG